MTAADVEEREDVETPPELEAWTFINIPPTSEQVRDLLTSLPEVRGVRTVDFIDYVQPLPQPTTRKRPREPGSRVLIEEKLTIYVLYMSVAGRIKMIERAEAINGWRVDFIPEKRTNTGSPGLISNGPDRIVYREYCRVRLLPGMIAEETTDGSGHVLARWPDPPATGKRKWLSLGKRPGQAWVPYSGGQNAKGTNPYEKVETSARGRAIAAWGFGVLPGSGVASLEEMIATLAESGRRDRQQEQEGNGGEDQGQGRRKQPNREERLQEIAALAEQIRQLRGYSHEEQLAKQRKYLEEILKIPHVWDEERKDIDWSRVSPGKLQLMQTDQQQVLDDILAERAARKAQEDPV